MWITAINEKRDHESAKQQGEEYGKVWKGEKGGEMMWLKSKNHKN